MQGVRGLIGFAQGMYLQWVVGESEAGIHPEFVFRHAVKLWTSLPGEVQDLQEAKVFLDRTIQLMMTWILQV